MSYWWICPKCKVPGLRWLPEIPPKRHTEIRSHNFDPPMKVGHRPPCGCRAIVWDARDVKEVSDA